VSSAGIVLGGQYQGIASSARIKKLELWACPTAVSGFSGFANIEWISSDGPSTQVDCFGTSSIPGHLTSFPPAKSNASFWTNAYQSTTFDELVLFNIGWASNVEILLDVTFEFTFNQVGVITYTSPGSTTNGLSYPYLDSFTSSGNVVIGFLRPVDLIVMT